jgi:DNA-binding transcriptional LysR family regulator
MLKEYDIKLNIKYALNDDYTAIALAEKGLGVTILPELIIEGTNYEICKKSLNPICDRLIGIGINNKENISGICEVFVEFVKEADICTLR